MNEEIKYPLRIQEIYLKLYQNPIFCTKDNLAEEYEVTTKAIENSLNKFDEIIYDKQQKRYRFKELLPPFIPYKVFYDLLNTSIGNENLRNDFAAIDKLMHKKNEIFFLETSNLSQLTKNIIMLSIAIENNCVVKIEYEKSFNNIEYKYIKPNTLFNSSFGDYSIYATYDSRNEKDIGEERTFKLQKIINIESVEYINNEVFKKNKIGNVFGEYKKDQYVTLVFDKASSNFFNSTGQFDNGQYEVVIGLGTDSVIVKMHYNNLDMEVVKILQQWMPHIKIHDAEPNKEKIFNAIVKNFQSFNI